jgi:uncharacterized protein YgiM (DUF1202 family)
MWGGIMHSHGFGLFKRIVLVFGLLALTSVAFAQNVIVKRNVNLRSDPSSEYDPLRLLTPDGPPLTLIDPNPESGYYHVKASDGTEGYVWAKNVKLVASLRHRRQV